MVDKINIGILGCANIAIRSLGPEFLASEKFRIVAVASRSLEKAIKVAEMFDCEAIEGYQTLVEKEDIDAIYIPLPPALHYDWAMQALRHGKHIFVEKSLGITFSQVSEILDFARSKKLCVFENFMFPYHSQLKFLEEAISSGRVGDIRLLQSSFGFPIFNPGKNIRYNQELGGGALFDAGAYTLMAAQIILGSGQKVIAASLENGSHDVDMQGSVMLQSGQGIISQLAFGMDNFYQNKIELWGSKAKLTLHRAFTAGPGIVPQVTIEEQDKTTEYKLPVDNHFQKIIQNFYNCIKEERYSYKFDQILEQAKLISEVLVFAGR